MGSFINPKRMSINIFSCCYFCIRLSVSGNSRVPITFPFNRLLHYTSHKPLNRLDNQTKLDGIHQLDYFSSRINDFTKENSTSRYKVQLHKQINDWTGGSK